MQATCRGGRLRAHVFLDEGQRRFNLFQTETFCLIVTDFHPIID